MAGDYRSHPAVVQPTGANPPPAARRAGLTPSSVPALGIASILLVMLVTVLDVLPRLIAPYGDSIEGAAGSTWSIAGRALGSGIAQDGTGGVVQAVWIASQHPPGTALIVTVMRAFGDAPVLLRVPPLVASLCAVVLLFRLLRSLGLSGTASVVGMFAMAGTPLFLHQSVVLRPEVLSLPAVLWLLRPRDPASTTGAWPLGLAAAWAGLTSWAGLLVAVALSVAVVVQSLARRERPDVVTVGLLWGTLVAMGLSVVWLAIPSGLGFAPLQTLIDVGPTMVVDLQGRIADLTASASRFLPVWTIALSLPALVAAIASRRTRRVGLVSLLMVSGPLLVLRDDAIASNGWTVLALVPVAIGTGVLVDLLVSVWGRSNDRPVRFVVFVSGLVAMLSAAIIPGGLDVDHARGLEAAALASEMRLPADQQQAFTFPADVRPSWLWFYTRRPGHAVDVAGLADLADSPSDVQVVVARRGPLVDDNHWRAVSFMSSVEEGDYALLPARSVIALVSSPEAVVGASAGGPSVSVMSLQRLDEGLRIDLLSTGLVPVTMKDLDLRLGNAQTPIRLSDQWLYNGSTASVCVGMSGPECTVVVSSPVDLTSDLPAVTLDGVAFRQ